MEFKTFFFFQALWVHSSSLSRRDVQAACGSAAWLPCEGMDASKDFISVAWYKLEGDTKLGLIRRGKRDEVPERFNFPREAHLGADYSLWLPAATPADSGRYECSVSANVGGKNLNPVIRLVVQECATPTPTPAPPPQCNATLHCDAPVQEVPPWWGLVGYAGLAVGKISLSLIILSVLHKTASCPKRSGLCG